MTETLWEVISKWPHQKSPDILHPKSRWVADGERELLDHTVSYEREEGQHLATCYRCQIERWAREHLTRLQGQLDDRYPGTALTLADATELFGLPEKERK